MTLYVEHLATLRSETPEVDIDTAITQGGAKGWSLLQIFPVFNEILIVWDKPDTEQRG